MKQRLKATPCSHLLLVKDNEILLYSRLRDEKNLCYNVVAGHIEQLEGPTACIIREAKEEIGIDIDKENIKLVHTMYKPLEKDERIEFFYLCEKWNGEIKNLEPHKCKELKYFDLNNLPKELVGYTRFAIENVLKNIHFSEYFDTDGIV